MRVRLLAFASAIDAIGGSEGSLELPPQARVADLREALGERFAAILPLLPRLAIAVEGEIAPDDRRIEDGAEIALLPPVSGG